METNQVEGLIRRLWSPVEGHLPHTVYGLVDAARSEAIYPRIMGSGLQSVCLHRGKMAEELAWVAPYLVRLQRDDPFTRWLLENGWGKSRCVFVRSSASFDELKRHFRSFLTVYDEAGKSYFFRYYDPRVLRIYLPTCNAMELGKVFGEVESYMLEEKEPAVLLAFSREGDSLRTEKIPVS